MKNNLLAIVLLLGLLVPPSLTKADYSQGAAQSYLLAHANNSWATMALASLNASDIPSDYLKSVTGTAATDYEKPILAITALGQDPRTFGSEDYVQKLESFYESGQIGDPNIINDDSFGILALISAGQPTSDQAVAGSKNFLLSHQNSDGGWGWSVNAGSDTNTTAAAVTALIASGVNTTDTHIQNALAYIESVQNSDGGFASTPGDASDASSTSWMVWALNAASINPSTIIKDGQTPLNYLQSIQDPSGFFPYQAGNAEDSLSPATTSYAVIALAGKTLPIKTIASTSNSQKYDFRIEGSSQTVCSGRAEGPTALDIIKNAAILCGFTYEIKATDYGPYLTTIGSDTGSGDLGWQYAVNNIPPSVGAANYQLKTGDSVLWYFGGWDMEFSKLTLPSSQINSGTGVTVTVQGWDGSNWQPLPDATVYYGASTATTTQDGTVIITPADGFYQIYSQKQNFVRSNTLSLQVGSSSQSLGSSSTVNLSVSLGQVDGASTTPPTQTQTVSFIVTPSSLNFGNLGAGQSSAKTLKLTNQGNTSIGITTQVQGNAVFTDNLSLNNTSWKNYSSSVLTASSTDIQAKLSIPQSLTSSGTKTGQLIFWATAQ